MGSDDFHVCFAHLGITNPYLRDRLIAVFNRDGSDFVDFEEFSLVRRTLWCWWCWCRFLVRVFCGAVL